MFAALSSEIRYRLRALFRRDAMERDLDDELQFHLQRETAKHLSAGLSPAQADRRARIDLGGVEVIKESSRDVRGIGWLERTGQDLRYAGRSLRNHPGFTAAVVLTLGLGIGVNAAMFGIVDSLMFRTPAYLTDAGRVHRIYFQRISRGRVGTDVTTQYTRLLDLQRWTHSFESLSGLSVRSLPVGAGTDAREMPVGTISASLFDYFDARPVLGRFFVASEDTVPVGALVAVLGYDYWQAGFGGRSDVLGQQLQVGTGKYTIIGVAPRNFRGITDHGAPAVFVPITAYAGVFRAGSRLTGYYTRYNWGWLEIVGRRRAGISQAVAEADLQQAYLRSWEAERTLDPTLPAAAVARPVAIAGPVQMERGPYQSTVSRVAAWVGGVALVVLLVACANVTNLMLARAVRRRREIALRLALGVSRGRLVAQLLTESVLLAGCGAVAGLLLAGWSGRILATQFLPEGESRPGLADSRTLAFALVIAVVCGLVTGMAPVLQARRTNLVDTLKSGARDGGYRHSRMRTGLLLLQAALSVILLVGAGLFVRSLLKVQALPLGYDVDSVLYVRPEERGASLSDPERVVLRQRLLERARAIPGVTQASLGLTVPFWDTWTNNLFVAGVDSVDRLGEFTLQAASPEYFATVGTAIRRGRGFTPADRTGAPGAVVVSEAMARTLWPGQEPLGQCLRMGSDTAPCLSVVGVSEDIKQNALTDDAGLHYFLPIDQFHPESAVLFVRLKGDPASQKEMVRRLLQPLMPGDGYITVTSMHEIVDPGIQSWRLGATMFLGLGGLALILAAIGLYSVIAYDVAQRTHELGVRIALGARVADVISLVVASGLRVALVGMAVGGVVALASGRWIAPLLFAQSPRDPVVFGAVTGVLLVVALLACAFPAFRASRVDPNEALRSE